MAAIRETFFQECEEQLAELEAGLILMESGAAEAETVNAVFRAVHSIKGGAARLVRCALAQYSASVAYGYWMRPGCAAIPSGRPRAANAWTGRSGNAYPVDFETIRKPGSRSVPPKQSQSPSGTVLIRFEPGCFRNG